MTDNGLPISTLVHPIYLDFPMLISFYAALEDGAAMSREITQSAEDGERRRREGGGKISVPSIFGLLGIDLSGRVEGEDTALQREEQKVVRHHTDASVFNLFRSRIIGAGAVKRLDTPGDLETTQPGDLVEIEGVFHGNPLQKLLHVFGQMLPYMAAAAAAEDEPAPPGSQNRSGGRKHPQRRNVEPEIPESLRVPLEMMGIIDRDLDSSPLIDVVLRTQGGVSAVAPLAREVLTPTGEGYLSFGRYRLLGKAADVLPAHGSVNLARRTAMGLMQVEVLTELVESLNSAEEMNVDLGTPVIEAPVVEVIPLAVYV